MEKILKNTAEEILEEFTNCYSEADEDCLVRMLRNMASDVAREIFEEIESKLMLNRATHCGQKFYYTRLEDDIAELKKKYESEGGE